MTTLVINTSILWNLKNVVLSKIKKVAANAKPLGPKL